MHVQTRTLATLLVAAAFSGVFACEGPVGVDDGIETQQSALTSGLTKINAGAGVVSFIFAALPYLQNCLRGGQVDDGSFDLDFWQRVGAEGITTFQIGVEPNRIDVITSIDGVEFAGAWDRSIDVAKLEGALRRNP